MIADQHLTPLPTGRDCICGAPTVWRGQTQRCAVYGRHLETCEPIRIIRDMAAPLAGVVDELDAMPMPKDTPRGRKADYRTRPAA